MKRILLLASLSLFIFTGCSVWDSPEPEQNCVTVPCSLDNFQEEARLREHGVYSSSDGKVGYKEGTYTVDRDKTINVGVWYHK